MDTWVSASVSLQFHSVRYGRRLLHKPFDFGDRNHQFVSGVESAAALEVAAEKACGRMKGLNAQKLTMPVDELHAAMCSPQVGTVKLQLEASGIIMLLTKEGWLEQDAGGIGRVALTLKGRTMPTPDELARPTPDDLAGSTDTFDEQVKFKALKWMQSREIAGNLP